MSLDRNNSKYGGYLILVPQQSTDQPIPVIFELSEWSSDNEKTVADWLSDQLKEKYNVSPNVSKQWIEQNQLLPLLDGLDELRRVDAVETATSEEIDLKRQAKQIQCMRSINAFLDVHPAMSMVVCCRRTEYETLQAQGEYLKRLNGAIYLQELDKDQIQNYFQISNREHLWDTLKNQPTLLKLARSPLFLLMFVVAYRGQAIQTTEELLDLYIEKQLNDLNNQGAYPPGKSPSLEKTRRYLSWLAVKLEEQKITEFLIERLQPDWLDRECGLKQYRLLVGLSVGLIFGLSYWLSYDNLGLGLSAGLSVGLSAALSYESGTLDSTESLVFSWKRASRLGLLGVLIFGLIGMLIFGLMGGLSYGLMDGLIAGLIFGLMGGLGYGLIFGLIGGSERIKPVESLRFSWKRGCRSMLSFGLIVGLVAGLNFGLIAGVIDGLITGVIGGLSVSESDIDEKQSPNQGIRRSIKIFILVGLIVELSVGLVDEHSVGPVFGLIVGLIVGLFAVIQHISLRLVESLQIFV